MLTNQPEINNLPDLHKSAVMCCEAGIDLRNVRVNGIPFDRLATIDQWAVELGYREAEHMAAHDAAHRKESPRP